MLERTNHSSTVDDYRNTTSQPGAFKRLPLILTLLLSCLAAPAPGEDACTPLRDNPLSVQRMQQGLAGLTFVMRHAHAPKDSSATQEELANRNLESDCLQNLRLLDADGKKQTGRMEQALSRLLRNESAVVTVIHSQQCRTEETAERVLPGRPTTRTACLNLPCNPETSAEHCCLGTECCQKGGLSHEDWLRYWLRTPNPDGVSFLFTHSTNMSQLIDEPELFVQNSDNGLAAVFELPAEEGGHWSFLGCLWPDDWGPLASEIEEGRKLERVATLAAEKTAAEMAEKFQKTDDRLDKLEKGSGTPGGSQKPSMKDQSKFGQILVGSPEIVTRERLVNDRLNQEAWLNKKLTDSEKANFDSFQGLVDYRSLIGLSARVGSSSDPNQGAIYDAQTRAYLADLTRQQREARIESQIRSLEQRRRLRMLLETETAADDAADADDDDSTTNATEDGETAAEEPSEPTPPSVPETLKPSLTDETFDAFLGRLTDESFGKSLADPSDAVPTQAKGTPVDRFRDELAYREEIRNEILENQLDDRHDLNGRSLYRFNIDATLLPRKNIDAWAKIDIEISQDDGQADWDALYEEWRHHLAAAVQKRFFENLGPISVCLDSPDKECELPLPVIERLASFLAACQGVFGGEPGVEPISPLQEAGLYCLTPSLQNQETRNAIQTDTNSAYLEARTKPAQEAVADLATEALLLSSRSDYARSAFNTIVKKLPGWGKDKDKNVALRESAKGHILKRFAAFELISQRGLYRYVRLDPPESLTEPTPTLTIDKTPNCTDAASNSCRFNRKLKEANDAYAYAATPKESAQRISRVSSSRSAMELGAMWSVLNQGAGSQAAANLVSQNQELLHGISRRPLTVGYTTTSQPGTASFGWIIGPKFELRRQHAIPRLLGIGKGYRYSHVPIQNTLAGVVSLPGWWQRASITATACWQKVNGRKCDPLPVGSPRTVDLPFRLQNVSEALAERNRGPLVRLLPKRWDFISGQSADILVVGDNLWRSAKVTVGSQTSDRITVLPNMSGIVATFDSLKETPYADGTAREVQLRVWTSTGVEEVGTVWIYPPKNAKKEALKLDFKAPRLVEEGVVALKIQKGKLPTGYSKLQMGLRQRIESTGTYGEWVFSEALPPAGEIKEITARFKAQNLSSFKNGSKIQAGLYVTSSPTSDREQLALSGEHIVYYQNDADTVGHKINVMGLGANNKAKIDTKLTFKFPKAAFRAFPGLDPAKTKLSLIVTSGDDKVSLVETDRKSEDDNAEHALILQAVLKKTADTFEKAKIDFKLEPPVPGLDFKTQDVEVTKP